jgi:hypothetical protein
MRDPKRDVCAFAIHSTRTMTLAAVALLMGSAGCQQASVVSLVVSTANSLPIVQLVIEVSLGATGKTLTMPSTPSSMLLGFPVHATILMPADATGTLTVTARGYDANGGLVASGRAQAQVMHGRGGPLSITLAGAETDMARPPDLARPCSYELCEGFESGQLNSNVWTETLGDTTKMNITVDDTVAHSGSYSLHLHSDALSKGSTMTALIAESLFVPTTTQPLFVRLWLKAAAWPSTNGAGTGHDALIEVHAPGASGEVLNIEASSQAVDQGSVERLDFLAYGGVPNNVYKQGTSPLPTGMWFCLEWGLAYDAQDMLIHSHTWLGDGDIEVALEADAAAASFNTMLIGMDEKPTDVQGPIDLWIDDIVISGAYVSCAE